jgi:hypothetical protein
MWFAHSTGGKADMPLAMMATIVQGDAGTASPTVGVLVHLVLSALIGAVFALAVPRLQTNGTVAVAGTAYGLLLYVVNFLVLAPLLFTTGRPDPCQQHRSDQRQADRVVVSRSSVTEAGLSPQYRGRPRSIYRNAVSMRSQVRHQVAHVRMRLPARRSAEAGAWWPPVGARRLAACWLPGWCA